MWAHLITATAASRIAKVLCDNGARADGCNAYFSKHVSAEQEYRFLQQGSL